jgi:hypothetical protein
VPAFFLNKDWDLGRESVGDTFAQVDETDHYVTFSQEETTRSDVKLPLFFMNKGWNLGSSSNEACAAPELPKPDETAICARQRRCSFRFQASDRFGMVLEETPEPTPHGLLVVTSLDACSAFAKTAGGSCGVLVGDVIIEVNGKHGDAATLREILRQSFSSHGGKVLELVVRSRPPTFNIELRREGKHWQRLGITASADAANPECLLVEGLHAAGLAPSWNTAHGSLRICKGDLITHVNGVCQGVAAMKKEIKDSSTRGSQLRFRIVTPAGKATGCHKELQETEPLARDLPWPETTVPWDMKVKWLDDDNMSEVSTACGDSYPSGSITPEEFFPSREESCV